LQWRCQHAGQQCQRAGPPRHLARQSPRHDRQCADDRRPAGHRQPSGRLRRQPGLGPVPAGLAGVERSWWPSARPRSSCFLDFPAGH